MDKTKTEKKEYLDIDCTSCGDTIGHSTTDVIDQLNKMNAEVLCEACRDVEVAKQDAPELEDDEDEEDDEDDEADTKGGESGA